LHHRYVAHPDKSYRIFVVRRRLTGWPLVLFVLQPDTETGCELLSHGVPRTAEEVERLMARARKP